MIKGTDGHQDPTQNELLYYYTKEILNNDDFHLLKNIPNHGSTDLFTHCINVSTKSMRICQKIGIDAKAASRGGLLHDFYLYDWRKGEGPGLHGFRHGKISLSESQKRFELTEKEKNIILRHMWPLTPIPPSSLEGLIVSIVDKICAVEEIFHLDDHYSSNFQDDLVTRGELSSKWKLYLFHKKLFFIKARVVASRFQALITG